MINQSCISTCHPLLPPSLPLLDSKGRVAGLSVTHLGQAETMFAAFSTLFFRPRMVKKPSRHTAYAVPLYLMMYWYCTVHMLPGLAKICHWHSRLPNNEYRHPGGCDHQWPKLTENNIDHRPSDLTMTPIMTRRTYIPCIQSKTCGSSHIRGTYGPCFESVTWLLTMTFQPLW